MKRTIAILLCALLVLALVPVSAWAIGGTLRFEEENEGETPTAAGETALPSDAAGEANEGGKPAGDAEAELPEEDTAHSYTRVGPFLPAVSGPALLQTQQNRSEGEDGGVETGKTVGEPDENGVYTLTLEAYATGEITITTQEQAVPCDIILVLDQSGSMLQDDFVAEYTKVTGGAYQYGNTTYYGFSAYNSTYYIRLSDGSYKSVSYSDYDSGRCDYYRYQNSSSNWVYVYPKLADGVTVTRQYGYDVVQFYTRTTTTRIAALKTAVSNFVQEVKDKAAADGVDHRIALVGFAGNLSYGEQGYKKTELLTPTTKNYSALTNADYAAALLSVTDSRLDTAVNNIGVGIDSYCLTYPNFGMDMARKILTNTPLQAGEQRQRVVVLFTDGTPGYDSISTTGRDSIANAAITYAKEIKDSGATMYTIGTFSGADPTDVSASSGGSFSANRFMNYLSSNYLSATSMTSGGTGSNKGYYLSAEDSADLNTIFTRIADEVQSGGTTSTLDETSTIQDVISDYFELETGTDADVDVYTADYLGRVGNVATGDRLWDELVPFTSPEFSVTVDVAGKTVITTGFDFSGNYVADIVTDGVITGHRGSKLVIEIRIVRGGTFGGNDVETNGPGSGVYPGGSDEPLEPFEPPHTNLPIAYEVTAQDLSVYAGDEVDISDLFNFIASDGANNSHVNIDYELYLGTTCIATLVVPAGTAYDEGDWNFLSGYNRVFEPQMCGQLQLKAEVVSVVQDPEQPDECNERDFDVTAKVHLFTPTVVFGDDTIVKGDTSDITDNVISVIWADATHSAAPSPAGAEPELRFTYDHADVEHYLADTPITVTSVLRGTKDITDLTVLTADAEYPAAHFVVYVTPCTLTIHKQGAAGENETFRFIVTRAADGAIAETWSIMVCVHGNGSVTLSDLPVGDYSVQEDTSWSWRYHAQEASEIHLDAETYQDELTVVNTIKTNRWLDGDSFLTNLFRLFEGN